jgi:hypothetical protein
MNALAARAYPHELTARRHVSHEIEPPRVGEKQQAPALPLST